MPGLPVKGTKSVGREHTGPDLRVNRLYKSGHLLVDLHLANRLELADLESEMPVEIIDAYVHVAAHAAHNPVRLRRAAS